MLVPAIVFCLIRVVTIQGMLVDDYGDAAVVE
jgi:hypothetical protein